VKTGGKYLVNSTAKSAKSPQKPTRQLQTVQTPPACFLKHASSTQLGRSFNNNVVTATNLYLEHADPSDSSDSDPERPESAEEMHTCSVKCDAMRGYVPLIPCQGCLCLFHNICVGISEEVEPELLTDFICSVRDTNC
jgi:hypothetical protein